MKPIKNIYPQIYEFENLYHAFLGASREKQYIASVMDYAYHLEENLIQLQNEFIHQTYTVGRYWEFSIYEPKKRIIMALPFKDRVAQWAMYRILNPVFLSTYIFDSFGCIKDKGPQAAAKRAQYKMRFLQKQSRDRVYYLKMDISKFFYRVDHEILLRILGKYFDDERLMWLFELIIKSEDQPFGLPHGYNPGEATLIYNKGMPIGNLTSQMFANVYMNELDQYLKREVRVKHYIRFMDDFVIFSDSKAQLHAYREIIERFLEKELKLHTNNKTAIRPIDMGLDFCGAVIYPSHMRLRKSTALQMRRRLRQLQEQYRKGEIDLDEVMEVVNSYRGLSSHYDTYSLRKSVFRDFVLTRDPQYIERSQ